ncbi:MAG: helix-turn-helix domain-containing protein [Streptosporangiales bacterium]|nr:helix-turn-helix domain-containing protein [Streptosporangiales bacterium]
MGSNGALHWRGGVPLSQHLVFATGDPEAAVVGATGLLAPHRLTLPAGAAGFAARVNARRWRDVMVAYFSYGVELQVTAGPLSDIYAVNLPLSGHADVNYAGARFHSSTSTAAVFSTTDGSTMRWTADHTVLCVTIRRAALERHLSRMLGRSVDHRIRFAPEMSVRRTGASWGGVAQTLVDVAERVPVGGQSPFVTAELEQTVMTTLLLAQPHSYSSALLDGVPSASSRTVAGAVEIMRSEPGARLTVATIAERVGVSERSLQLAFRRQTGTSPGRHLRDMRLDRARHTLLTTAADERSISRIATEWGFFHLGRFAGAYRRRFGENPSQTSRRRRV